MNTGDIVISNDLTALFKVIKVIRGKCMGFNILNNSSLITKHQDELIYVDSDTPLIKKLCSNEDLRIELASLFTESVKEIGEFTGMHERSVFRKLSNNK